MTGNSSSLKLHLTDTIYFSDVASEISQFAIGATPQTKGHIEEAASQEDGVPVEPRGNRYRLDRRMD